MIQTSKRPEKRRAAREHRYRNKLMHKAKYIAEIYQVIRRSKARRAKAAADEQLNRAAAWAKAHAHKEAA